MNKNNINNDKIKGQNNVLDSQKGIIQNKSNNEKIYIGQKLTNSNNTIKQNNAISNNLNSNNITKVRIMNINSKNNNANNQLLINNNSSLQKNNLNHFNNPQNFTSFQNSCSNNIRYQNNYQSLYNNNQNYVTSYRSQNYLSNQNNGTISNLGGTNINSGSSSSICEGSCNCGNLEGGICCGRNWCSYSWKLVLSVIICIIVICFIIEGIEDYKKEQISKVNSKGEIPTIDKSSKTSSNFCNEIQNFINKLDNKTFGESIDSIEKKDKLKEKACKEFKSKDERCITCYIKMNYGTNCILIHNSTIYEDFKNLIGYYMNGESFKFTYAYCQEVNIKFYYFYIILIILLI